jgi:hypothetical protein
MLYNMGFTLELAFLEVSKLWRQFFINKHSSEYSESKINQIRAENFLMELYKCTG